MAIMKASMILVSVLGTANLCAARRVKVSSKRIESQLGKASVHEETAHVHEVTDISVENTSLTTADSQQRMDDGLEIWPAVGNALNAVSGFAGTAATTLVGTGAAHLNAEGNEFYCLSSRGTFCWHAPRGDFRLRVLCGKDFKNGTCDDKEYPRCDKSNWWLVGVRMAAQTESGCPTDKDLIRNEAIWSIFQHNGVCRVLRKAFEKVKAAMKPQVDVAMHVKMATNSVLNLVDDVDAFVEAIAKAISDQIAKLISENVVLIIQEIIFDDWVNEMIPKLKTFLDNLTNLELDHSESEIEFDATVKDEDDWNAKIFKKVKDVSAKVRKELEKQWKALEGRMNERLPNLLEPVLRPVVKQFIVGVKEARAIVNKAKETEVGQLLVRGADMVQEGIKEANNFLSLQCAI